MRFGVAVLLISIPVLRAAERCDVPPQYAGLSREALKDRLKESPDDFTLNRLFVDSATYENLAERARYSALLRQHSGSIDYQYLQARSLVGTDSKEALRIYGQILEKDPDYPWVHLSQLEIFKAEGFLDRKKLQASFETFTRVCPSSFAPYYYLDQLPDHDLAVRAAAKLRAMLKTAKDPRDLATYQLLWSEELQFRPAGEEAEERRQIGEDVKQLLPLLPSAPIVWAYVPAERYSSIRNVIQQGAFLDEAIGDRALRARLAAERRAMQDEFRAWQKAHPNPKFDAPADIRNTYYTAKLTESKKLLEMAPRDYLGYMERFDALRMMEAPAEELLRAGEEYLAAVFHQDDIYPWQMVNQVGVVPNIFANRGIYLDRVPALIDEIVERVNNDLLPTRSEPERRMSRVSGSVGDLWSLVDAYEKLGQREKARETVRRMETMVAANQPPADMTDREVLRAYSSGVTDLWQCKARLAEQEGRKLDALIAYREVSKVFPPWAKDNLPAEHKLWTELGGSEEEWPQWVASMANEPAKPAPAAAAESWIRKLPDMSLTDFAGNKWTLDRFQGKTVIAPVWATWCGWCIQEMHQVQDLMGRLKGRDDVIAVSFNIDDNVGEAEADYKKLAFSFPSLAAKQYAQGLASSTGLPRMWIIKNGAIIYETVGFDPKNDKWVDQMLARLK